MEPAERFAAALLEVEARLDWEALGRVYCSEGGADFFGPEDREALRDAGLRVAAKLGDALLGLPRGGSRRSLYVGAALAELAPMLFEVVVRGREVVAVNLHGEEARMLDGALAEVGTALDVALPRIETRPLAEQRDFDHVWIVSVLNDPETFPALHDELYGRQGAELATGRGDAEREREAARKLLADALESLATPAIVTTTDEELPLVAGVLRERGLVHRASKTAILSPIVGDPIRMLSVSAAT